MITKNSVELILSLNPFDNFKLCLDSYNNLKDLGKCFFIRDKDTQNELKRQLEAYENKIYLQIKNYEEKIIKITDVNGQI